ncbi:THO complex subunit 4B [Glycine max]|nr:THO complex subunit 4B [Glycine max]
MASRCRFTIVRNSARTMLYRIPRVRQHSMIAFPEMVQPRLKVTPNSLFNLDHGVADDDIKIGRSKGTTEVVFVRHYDALAAIKKYNNETLKIEFVGTCSATPVVAPLCQTNLMGRPNDVHLRCEILILDRLSFSVLYIFSSFKSKL